MRKRKAKSALIFIDTNIYLDFYRTREKTFETSMIQHIDDNRDKIITTDQIFMEYKKNRQTVIIDTLKYIRKPEINIQAPAFLSEAQPIKMINKEKDSMHEQRKKLKKRILEVLKKPTSKNELYQCLQKLFKEGCKYHLGRDNDLRFHIRRLARKRFCLGYPPRKNNSISIGDAINWEWIIHCAEESGEDIVIVSRDRDYGEIYESEPILNDWLCHEFKDRISQQRKITLTNELSHAFKQANVKIGKKEEEEEEEKRFLSERAKERTPIELNNVTD